MSSKIAVSSPYTLRLSENLDYNLKPDLKFEVMTLASNIEVAMASLYSLQTYLIRTRGSHSQPLRDVFTPLRRDLKQSWGPILVFLQKSHAFGTDVTILKDSLSTESVEDCVDFLMSISSTSGDLLRLSDMMVGDSGLIVEEFARCVTSMGLVPQQSTPIYELWGPPSMGRSDGTVNGMPHFKRAESSTKGPQIILITKHNLQFSPLKRESLCLSSRLTFPPTDLMV
jgi:hypothetical protein